MNTLREMFLKTGTILIILHTVHAVVEERTNRTCMGYDSSRENLVNETITKNKNDLSEIAEGTGSSESSIVLDPHISTTQNYENSKLLFNYIVPEPSKIEKEEEKDEYEEEVEEEAAAKEDEEEEEEEEYRKQDVKEEDENADAEDHEEAENDQKDNVTAGKEEEREEEDEGDGEKQEEEEEKEEEDQRLVPDHEDKEDYQHGEEAEEYSAPMEIEERTEKGTTRTPIMPWRHSYPTLMREIRPRLDFTTVQPHEDPKPVSYSSVVYDPEGNSKTELSGSFYKKPIKLIPRSKLFRKEPENVSEDTKTIHVTTSPMMEERSIQSSSQEENEDDFDSIKHGFEDRPMKLNLKVPRHGFEWALPKTLEGEEESKKYNEKKIRQKYRDESNREKFHEQVLKTRLEAEEKGLNEGDESYESEVQDLMKPQTEWRHETVRKEVLSEEDEVESAENCEPTKKDRNQLYEYVVENVPIGQNTENKATQSYRAATVKKDDISTPVPPENKTVETITVKPYSFGTITKSNQALTFNNPDNSDILYNQIVSDIQSMFKPPTPKPTNYEQHFLPNHVHCRTSPPNHDSGSYETFIQPSHFQHGEDEEEEEEDEEENPMPKRLPMKTYILRKKPVKKPSGIKVTVYPVKSRPHMIYREAKPVSFRNSIYSGPIPSSNKLIRKIFYYEPNQKILHYSPTNQILRVVRPQTTKFRSSPSSRVIITRKL